MEAKPIIKHVDATHYIFGDYVITGISNAFDNKKTSYWISKKGVSRALYCFSTECGAEDEVQYQLCFVKAYIKMFEEAQTK